MMKNDDMIELLADFEYDRWSRWQKYLFSKCIVNSDGTLTMPKELVDRWTRQMNTNYKNLPEEEKNSDRREARRIIECIRERTFDE